MSRQTSQSTYYSSPSQAIEDSKKRTSLLKDNSWIKLADEEDEAVDRDPNFGRTVLGGRYTQTTKTVVSSDSNLAQPTSTRTSTSSVQALTKRFSTSQDELNTRTSVSDQPQTSTTTTTITENGKTTVTTTTKSSTKTDAFMDRVFSDRTKGTLYSSYTPTRKTVTETSTTSSSKDPEDNLFDTLLGDTNSDSKTSKTEHLKTETVIVKSSDDNAEDKLYDTLIPSPIKDESKMITTEIVTIKSRSEPDDKIITTSRTSTSSMAEDQLYDTLIPKAISNPSTPTSSSTTRRSMYTVSSSGGDSPTLSSTTRTSSYSSYTDEYPSSRTSTYTISTKTSDDITSDTKTFSYNTPESSYESYTSLNSPSSYTSTTYKTTRIDDILGDTYSRCSVTNAKVYTSPERTLLEKDMCNYCRKPFTGDAKIILDDKIKINCHATCFKCEVCNSTLGHLKAGDSMWVYKGMVHCDRCFEVTRDKWRR